jgi:hypothetical protein
LKHQSKQFVQCLGAYFWMMAMWMAKHPAATARRHRKEKDMVTWLSGLVKRLCGRQVDVAVDTLLSGITWSFLRVSLATPGRESEKGKRAECWSA